MYKKMSLSGFYDSRKISSVKIKFAVASVTGERADDEPERDAALRGRLECRGIERNLPGFHAPRLQIGGRALDELLGFHLHERFRQLERRAIEERLQHLRLHTRLDALIRFALDIGADLASHLGHV